MREREVIKAENAHILGGGNGTPCVVIDRGQTETTVWVANPVWGMGGAQQLTFLNPRPGGAADRYALKLKQRIEYAAARELERRGRRNGGGL